MKISELIEHLQQYDQDQDIMVWDWSTLEHIEIDTVSLYDSDDKQSKNNPLSISINDKKEREWSSNYTWDKDTGKFI